MSVSSKIPNVVFLGLLVVLSLFSDRGFGTAETIVDTDPHVVLEVGNRGILPCRIQRRGYPVEWKRQLSSGTKLLVSLDPYFDVGERDGPGYEAGLFNITEDYSLVINDVKVQDEGLYLCSFSDYATGKLFRNSTRVSVQASPDEPFPTIQECIRNFAKPDVCTLAIHATSNLTCFVKGYYPDIDLFFLHGTEKVTPSAYKEWNNTDGTKNMVITIQINVSDKPYECVASRLLGNAGNRSVSVFFQARSKGPRTAAIVAPVLIVVGICLSIAVIFKCYLGNRRGGELRFVLVPSRSPIEVVTGNDPERIKAYGEALESGKVRCNRSRIMVVGPAGVGKTSLIRRLMGQPFNPAERSTVGTEHNTVKKNVVSGWKLDNDTNRDEVAECMVLHQGWPTFFGSRATADNWDDLVGRSNAPRAAPEEQSEEQEQPSDSSASPSDTSHRAPSDAASTSEVTKSSSEDSPDKRKYIEKRKSLVQIQQGALPSLTEGGVPDVPQNVLERRSSSDHDSGGKQRKVIAEGLTKKRITNATSTANNISYSIWDFGGQVIYYITHPLFLSWRSLYIVVFPFHLDFDAEPPRTEEISIQGATPRTHLTILDLLHFWLMSIYVHAVPPRDCERFEPKILLVGTFCHAHSITEEDVKSKISQIKKMVQGKPYAEQVHKEILQIDNSSSSEKEVTYIQEQIDELVKESAYMQEDLPIRWRTFSDKMRALKKDMVLLDEARTAMIDVGIIKDKEVELVLEFYHDTGDLIYHQGCDLIVLNPQFLNNFVSNIITVVDDEKLEGELGDDWKTLTEKGILTKTLLEAVWESNEGKAGELKYLIVMMVKFDLVCKIPEDSKLKGCYFVPCCSRPGLSEVQKLDEDDKDDEFEFIIDFNKFLPDGFLHRLYVRMASWSVKGCKIPYEPTFHCREMLFYIDELHRVVMTNTIKGDDAHRIKVLICRRKPKSAPKKRAKRISLKRDFITYLRDTLKDLKKTWARRISYSFGLACTRCHDKGKRFSLIPLEDFLECEDSAHCGECGDAIHAGRVKQVFEAPSQPTSGPLSQPRSGPLWQPRSGSPSQSPSGPPWQPASGSPWQPASGRPWQPASGPLWQPASGPLWQPASGLPWQPASGPPWQPASGPPWQPPSGRPWQPASGPPWQPPSGPPWQPPSGPPWQPPSGPPWQPASGPPWQPASGPPWQPASVPP